MTRKEFQDEILPLRDRLYRYVLSIVFRKELARDIVQEVFLKVWERKTEMSSIKNKEAWCVRCARNLSLDKLKAHGNRVRQLTSEKEHAISTPRPDHIMETKDLLATVQKLMVQLPEKQREIFRLKEWMGYSNQEIEEILNLDAGRVKVNLFRARRKIRDSLSKLINYGLQEN